MKILGFGKDPRTHLSRVVVSKGYISAITYHAGPRGYKVEIVRPDLTVVSDNKVYNNLRQACCVIRDYVETQQNEI